MLEGHEDNAQFTTPSWHVSRGVTTQCVCRALIEYADSCRRTEKIHGRHREVDEAIHVAVFSAN
jgi:hypothetical protein